MRLPQLLIYDNDSRLAERLRDTAKARHWRWALRRPRLPATCLKLLSRGGPSVLVVRLERDLKNREMPLLEKVTWLFPDTAAVVICDSDDPALTGLAWDLGASLVLSTAQAREQLADILAGLMESAINKTSERRA
jgi:hypothetical protein